MSVVAVVGAQWGDEGKGRIVDLLAGKARIVARYQGGNNAGHTVVNQLGTFKLHLIPAGIFDPSVTCVIGNGVVVDPGALIEEIDSLIASGVSVDSLRISDRAHVVMPYHTVLDRLEEESRGGNRIGTTGRGVGPAYVDKAARSGIRIGDLVSPRELADRLAATLPQKNRVLTQIYGAEPLDFDDLYERGRAQGNRLRPFVADAGGLIRAAAYRGDNVLLEGGQGTLLDLDHGTYPFVTSSSPTAGGACLGVGLGPRYLDHAMGIFKAYVTRVGAGPFPTELNGYLGDGLRERGLEFGTTTGRARRCGWFDAVLARYAVDVNGLDRAAITKLDVLDQEPVIRICTAYRCGDAIVSSPPASLSDLAHCEPVYEEMPGWQESTEGARRFSDLPSAAKKYVDRLAELIGCQIDLVSVGCSRDQVIELHEVFC